MGTRHKLLLDLGFSDERGLTKQIEKLDAKIGRDTAPITQQQSARALQNAIEQFCQTSTDE